MRDPGPGIPLSTLRISCTGYPRALCFLPWSAQRRFEVDPRVDASDQCSVSAQLAVDTVARLTAANAKMLLGTMSRIGRSCVQVTTE